MGGNLHNKHASYKRHIYELLQTACCFPIHSNNSSLFECLSTIDWPRKISTYTETAPHRHKGVRRDDVAISKTRCHRSIRVAIIQRQVELENMLNNRTIIAYVFHFDNTFTYVCINSVRSNSRISAAVGFFWGEFHDLWIRNPAISTLKQGRLGIFRETSNQTPQGRVLLPKLDVTAFISSSSSSPQLVKSIGQYR